MTTRTPTTWSSASSISPMARSPPALPLRPLPSPSTHKWPTRSACSVSVSPTSTMTARHPTQRSLRWATTLKTPRKTRDCAVRLLPQFGPFVTRSRVNGSSAVRPALLGNAALRQKDSPSPEYLPTRFPQEYKQLVLSLIHISEPTRQAEISYAVFC